MKKEIKKIIITKENDEKIAIIEYSDKSIKVEKDNNKLVNITIEFIKLKKKKNVQDMINEGLIKVCDNTSFYSYIKEQEKISDNAHEENEYNKLLESCNCTYDKYLKLLEKIDSAKYIFISIKEWKNLDKKINRMIKLIEKGTSYNKLYKLNNKILKKIDNCHLKYRLVHSNIAKDREEFKEIAECIYNDTKKTKRKDRIISKSKAKRIVKKLDEVEEDLINATSVNKGLNKYIRVKKKILKHIEDRKKFAKGKFIKYKKLKTTWFLFKIVFFGALSGVTAGVLKQDCDIIKKALKPSSQKESRIISDKSLQAVFSSNNSNFDRTHFLKTVYNYLSNYNYRFARKLNKDGKKPALSFDEVVAQILVYNNFSKKQIINIFGSYELDSKKLLKDYKKAILQDQQAYVVATNPTGKEMIINRRKHSNFYIKYEALSKKYNILKKVKTKRKIAKKIKKKVLKDFYKKKKIKGYKTSVISVINSMNIRCNRLNSEYRLKFSKLYKLNNKIIYKTAYQKLKKYERILNNNNCNKKELYSYQVCRAIITNNLQNQNIYNIKDKERNITNQKQYKDSIKAVTPNKSINRGVIRNVNNIINNKPKVKKLTLRS